MATIRLNADFKEFLSLLNSERIEYLLIGGYAVWLYGYPRATKDMDVWVAVDPENEARLSTALVKFGISSRLASTPLFTEEKPTLRMGIPPNRLEILSRIAGVEFRDCYARRQVMEIEGVAVPVISLDDLIKNKRSTGRPHDAADVDRLTKGHDRDA